MKQRREVAAMLSKIDAELAAQVQREKQEFEFSRTAMWSNMFLAGFTVGVFSLLGVLGLLILFDDFSLCFPKE